MKADSSIVYRIDAADRLVQVNETWHEFARENNGASISPERILGASLWSFIADDTVHDIYHRLVQLARAGHVSAFNYRCDAPGWRRVFRMSMAGLPENHVQFTSELISQTPRPPIRLLDAHQPRDERLVRVCSWCHRVSFKGDPWLPLEKGVETYRLLAGDTLPRLTHGICPACAEHYFQMGPLDVQQPATL